MKKQNENPIAKRGAVALAIVVIFIIGMMAASCTKMDQPELDGRPLKRPVSVVVVK